LTLVACNGRQQAALQPITGHVSHRFGPAEHTHLDADTFKLGCFPFCCRCCLFASLHHRGIRKLSQQEGHMATIWHYDQLAETCMLLTAIHMLQWAGSLCCLWIKQRAQESLSAMLPAVVLGA
jgi:hypothetical protein